ncbi:MAG: hypothetical protein SCH39_13320, partial [Methanosarcinales archaeon]|nr:hypothetical protein [Methanosarcinales archaeon]
HALSSRPPVSHPAAPSCDEEGGRGRRRGEDDGGVPPWLLKYISYSILHRKEREESKVKATMSLRTWRP